jgi:hypothetical protein
MQFNRPSHHNTFVISNFVKLTFPFSSHLLLTDYQYVQQQHQQPLHLPNWLKLSKELTTLLTNHDKIYELLDGPTTAMG